MRGTLTGIDTFSYYYPLTCGQKDRIIRSLKGREQFRVNREDYFEETYDYVSGCFAHQGVKIRVHRKRNPSGGCILSSTPRYCWETGTEAPFISQTGKVSGD